MSTQFEENAENIKPGAIFLWSKTESEFPDGFVYCDGNNGTPDLRSKFTKSTTNVSDSSGQTGGQDDVTLTQSQLPSHSHDSGSTDPAGSHAHDLHLNGDAELDDDPDSQHVDDSTPEYTIQNAGSHSHSITATQVGSSSAIENRPSYTELHYIMKV
jgi:microcystin-dependent protein